METNNTNNTISLPETIEPNTENNVFYHKMLRRNIMLQPAEVNNRLPQTPPHSYPKRPRFMNIRKYYISEEVKDVVVPNPTIQPKRPAREAVKYEAVFKFMDNIIQGMQHESIPCADCKRLDEICKLVHNFEEDKWMLPTTTKDFP